MRTDEIPEWNGESVPTVTFHTYLHFEVCCLRLLVSDPLDHLQLAHSETRYRLVLVRLYTGLTNGHD
jgi:hypothetical protein